MKKRNPFAGDCLVIQKIWQMVLPVMNKDVDAAVKLTNQIYQAGFTFDQIRDKSKEELIKMVNERLGAWA